MIPSYAELEEHVQEEHLPLMKLQTCEAWDDGNPWKPFLLE